MCLYPKLIKNKKYTSNKKNGGNVPVCIDERCKLVPVKCGKCIECRKQISREWQVRLMEDVRVNKNGHFVTMTFNDESIARLSREIKDLKGYELDNEIATLATRRFLERWRKKYKKSVRHWLITEIGHNGTENIHMHGIIWTDEKASEIEKIWGYGMVWGGYDGKRTYVNEKTISYMTKYMTKIDAKHKEYKPKILTSPGIGKNYTNRVDSKSNKYKKGETKEYYKTRSGHKIAMPIYWRNKIYSEDEREKLWIEKLDKKERWVLGVKVDISKNDISYNKLLIEARKKNKRLGYGDDEKNWDRKRYEMGQRILKQKQRIAKGIAKNITSGGASPAGQVKVDHTEKLQGIERFQNRNNWE